MDTHHFRKSSGNGSSNVIAMNFDAAYFFERGVRFLQRNDLNKALKAFRKTVEYEPNNPVNYCNLAGVYSEMGDFEASNELLEHVLCDLDPNMTECQFYLANNYANMGEYDTAEEYVLRYLDADPNGEYADDAEEMLSVLLDEFGGGRAFEKWQEEKRKLDAQQATKDGRYFLENGQFEAAVEWLESVIEEEPENYAAYNNLCLAYYYTGQHDKALSLADDVLHRQPDNIHALCNRAILVKHFGWRDALDAAAEPLRKVFPLHYDLAMKVGTTLGIIGYHADALETFRRLIRLTTPAEPVLIHATAAAAANCRNWSVAERFWQMLARETDYQAVADHYLQRVAEARKDDTTTLRVSYQLDLPVEEQLAVVKDKLKDTKLEAWRRDPLLRASLYWGLRHGNHETRRRVIRALAVVADEDAEKALRLFVGRPDIDETLRLHAVVALKRIGARGSVRLVAADGEREVSIEQIDPDVIFDLNPSWRDVWVRTEEWLHKEHLQRLVPEAKRLWLTYLYDMFLHVHRRIGKADIWVAGLIYITLRYFGVPVVQRELAEEFVVAASSIRKCSARLEQSLLTSGI
ncbi:tetratricopeptide repeat protein [Alicyclobacillus fastidiosus]|uniref:Tetratricopeptide repeat protein n=2 Tax=Alicyclobacillus fastidiosus TaxID=392011 RepID=A0ABV5AKT4_9BACL|nr:tetratricopeptide repeat protein [Alicyclobacillus fastidiosus]WEH09359.1 tetratricopeptide repeat protein [Alicyclobacillus fastidiosus]